jgi:hypothetical protein
MCRVRRRDNLVRVQLVDQLVADMVLEHENKLTTIHKFLYLLIGHAFALFPPHPMLGLKSPTVHPFCLRGVNVDECVEHTMSQRG